MPLVFRFSPPAQLQGIELLTAPKFKEHEKYGVERDDYTPPGPIVDPSDEPIDGGFRDKPTSFSDNGKEE